MFGGMDARVLPWTIWVDLCDGGPGRAMPVNRLPVAVVRRKPVAPHATATSYIECEIEHLVATGNVHWEGDTPFEVYVPQPRLHEWRSEHDIDR